MAFLPAFREGLFVIGKACHSLSLRRKVQGAKCADVELKEFLLWTQSNFLLSKCRLFADPGRCCPLEMAEFPLGCALPKGANIHIGCVISGAVQNKECPDLPVQTH